MEELAKERAEQEANGGGGAGPTAGPKRRGPPKRK